MNEINTEKTKIEKVELPVISYSKLTTYKTCNKSYKFAYIDKLPRLDKPYTIFGQFCHKALEAFHIEYLNGSKEPIDIIMQKSFQSAKDEWKEKMTSDQIKEAFQIMQDYLNIISNGEMPKVSSIEKKIYATIDDTLILYGFIDRIQVDDDGVVHIVDYKTTKDERFLTDRTQLLLYAYTVYLENKDIKKIRTSYIMLKHKMKFLTAEHSVDELIETKDKLLHTWETIKSDKLYRAAPVAWKCKNCDYVSSCKEGQRLVLKGKNFGEIDW
ncbi:MAG: RecB family exonuclease [Bacteroidia bacterium]